MAAEKSIRIGLLVHKELKAFVGINSEETIVDFAGFAIMKELKARGHKFIYTPADKSKKTKK